MSFSYAVAIKLTATNLASQGIRMLAGDLLKAHGAATNLQGKLKALKLAAVGFGVSKVGDDMLGFMHKAVDASKGYTHQLALMNAAGFTQRELAESTAAAWKTTGSVITTTAAGNLEAIRELRSAFGKGEGMEHAYAVLPIVQRAASILESITGRKQEHVAFDMIKAIETGTKGAVTVQNLAKQSEMMTKAIVQMGGTVNVADFHAAIKYSRLMAPYLSDDFKYNYLPTLIQEMKTGKGGAQAAGTIISSLGQVIIGHQIPKELIPNWVAAGLIKPGSVVKDRHSAGKMKILPGATAGEEEFEANPETWAQKYLSAAINKLMRDKHLTQMSAILALTHNQRSEFGMSTLVNKGVQFERDRKLITEGPTTKQSYDRLLKLDPQMAEEALHAQWQNLLSIIGYQIMPKLLPVIVSFANTLNRLAQAMARHPRLTSDLVLGFTGLGIALSILGKVLMTAGLVKFLGIGPIISRTLMAVVNPLGIFTGSLLPGFARALLLVGRAFLFTPWGLAAAGIAAAAYAIYKHWSTVGPFLSKAWSIVTALFKSSFEHLVRAAKNFWVEFGPGITKAISILKALGKVAYTAGASLYHSITGWLSSILSWVSASGIGHLVGAATADFGRTVSREFDKAYKWSVIENEGPKRNVIRPAGGRMIQVHTVIKQDGRKMAEAHTAHQARDAARPSRSGYGYDPTRNPIPLGVHR